MAYTVTKNLSTDFGGDINLNVLKQAINDDGIITTPLQYINVHDENVDIVFDSEPSAPELTQLDVLISAHVGTVEDPSIILQTVGSTDTTTTIEAKQTSNITITLPDATTELVGDDTTHTFTNKTINTSSNTIIIDAGDITTGTLDDARVVASNVTQHESAIDHQNLTGAGTNTHAQIDYHIADDTLHRVINDVGTGTTELWSADKINTELGTKASSSHNHVAADVTDFDTAADARITAQKGANNGLATLDGGGKVPSSQLSLSNVVYVGTWNATTNTPTLVDGTGTQGNYYVVSVAGSTNIDGVSDWGVGDWIIFNGTVWEKSDHTDSVTSVAGKQGAVTLQLADITDLVDTADLPEGTNLYYTEARVNANSNIVANTAKVSADGSVTTHSDVVVTSVTDNELMTYDTATSKWINQTPAEVGLSETGHTHVATDITDFDTEVSNNSSVVANTAKVSADGSITDHSDVVVTSVADDEVLTYDTATSKWINQALPVCGTQQHYQASEGLSTTTSTTLQTKTTLTTSSLPSGTYRLGYTCEVSNSADGVLTEVEVKLDGTVIALPTMSANNDFLLFGGFVQQSLSGVITATIKHRTVTTSPGTSEIRRARLELYRIA